VSLQRSLPFQAPPFADILLGVCLQKRKHGRKNDFNCSSVDRPNRRNTCQHCTCRYIHIDVHLGRRCVSRDPVKPKRAVAAGPRVCLRARRCFHSRCGRVGGEAVGTRISSLYTQTSMALRDFGHNLCAVLCEHARLIPHQQYILHRAPSFDIFTLDCGGDLPV